MTHIIYGIHPVKEALSSPAFQCQKIFIGTSSPNLLLQSILDTATEKKIPVAITPAQTLDRMTEGGVHQQVVALVQGTLYTSLEEILSRWKKGSTPALLLILDGIQDPQNLGSLVRTALGCGAHGILIPRDRAAGITPAVVKASAGAAAYLPIARVVNIATTIETLKEAGIWVFGAAGEAPDPLYDLDLKIDLALVIGAEGKGIRPLVKKRCDRLFSIPMQGPITSFNASVSGGMALYEVMRQRHGITKGKQP
jgi:23S rRNA (guanosine2251-2'-O)-methyltransferase